MHVTLHKSWYRLALVVAIGIGSVSGTACASTNLETRLKDRYQLDRVEVSEDARGAAAGQFNLRGQLTESAAAQSRSLVAGGLAPSAEALARAFVANNLQLFDIADAERELELVSRQRDAGGNRHLRFHRLVDGLRLEGMELLFHVSPDGEVRGANGNIVRISAELREHLQKNPELPKQKESEILETVAGDLGLSSPADLRVRDLQLLATNQKPFVVWQLEVQVKKSIAHYCYRISDTDASILQKRDLIRMKSGVRGNWGTM